MCVCVCVCVDVWVFVCVYVTNQEALAVTAEKQVVRYGDRVWNLGSGASLRKENVVLDRGGAYQKLCHYNIQCTTWFNQNVGLVDLCILPTNIF